MISESTSKKDKGESRTNNESAAGEARRTSELRRAGGVGSDAFVEDGVLASLLEDIRVRSHSERRWWRDDTSHESP